MNQEEQKKYLEERLQEAGIQADDRQVNALLTYYEMLVEKNKVMNLTAITEFEEVVSKHFLDSLMFQPEKEDATLIDVGTGAGFPGIPLKIMHPELKVTLMDSLNKRLNFLQEVIEALELKDICTVHGRAEDLGRNPEYREQFDYAVSRAVANLATLSEYCLPFVKVGGSFVSYKGPGYDEELKNAKHAIFLLSAKAGDAVEGKIPGTDLEHVLIPIKKVEKMSKKYPRKAGMPSKGPLK